MVVSSGRIRRGAQVTLIFATLCTVLCCIYGGWVDFRHRPTCHYRAENGDELSTDRNRRCRPEITVQDRRFELVEETGDKSVGQPFRNYGRIGVLLMIIAGIVGIGAWIDVGSYNNGVP